MPTRRRARGTSSRNSLSIEQHDEPDRAGERAIAGALRDADADRVDLVPVEQLGEIESRELDAALDGDLAEDVKILEAPACGELLGDARRSEVRIRIDLRR